MSLNLWLTNDEDDDGRSLYATRCGKVEMIICDRRKARRTKDRVLIKSFGRSLLKLQRSKPLRLSVMRSFILNLALRFIKKRARKLQTNEIVFVDSIKELGKKTNTGKMFFSVVLQKSQKTDHTRSVDQCRKK
ncbi:2404_t:CDS:2 [Paraglomus occultum]|uniref:2404_t:CDS:1 n=1 Tax=Paraglomus occultum TaxID=144539 RepID=A0A9N9DA41_9GLOM|nr:2404_t:CDS:2 [Paraglomus occultum]